MTLCARAESRDWRPDNRLYFGCLDTPDATLRRPGSLLDAVPGLMRAAGDNAGTASGLGALLLAAAPFKNLSSIQSKLTVELAKTAGVKAS